MFVNIILTDVSFWRYHNNAYEYNNKRNKSNEKALDKNWSNPKANSALKTKMGNNKKSQIDKIQWEQMANRVGSYCPKGGHSATQTELKV